MTSQRTFGAKTRSERRSAPTTHYLGTPISPQSAEHLRNLAERKANRPMGARPCSCGCGKTVNHYTQECFPQPWWDTPNLPPRRMDQRCATHIGCAYRDDDPYRCGMCHTIPERCTC